MNTDDELLIIQGALPCCEIERAASFADHDFWAVDHENDSAFYVDLRSAETRENLCDELKIGVVPDIDGNTLVHSVDHSFSKRCKTKEEKHAAINECSLAILKQEK